MFKDIKRFKSRFRAMPLKYMREMIFVMAKKESLKKTEMFFHGVILSSEHRHVKVILCFFRGVQFSSPMCFFAVAILMKQILIACTTSYQQATIYQYSQKNLSVDVIYFDDINILDTGMGCNDIEVHTSLLAVNIQLKAEIRCKQDHELQ